MAITAKELPALPPGNPFHHDAISCGMRLRDAVVIDEQFYPELLDVYIMFGGKLKDGLYLVNAATGERIQIVVT